MNIRTKTEINFNSIKDQRNNVDCQKQQLWTSYVLDSEKGLPLVVEAIAKSVDLQSWIDKNINTWNSLLVKHGVIFFRGFGVYSAYEMERMSRILLKDIFHENTEHQPLNGYDFVQQPVAYDHKEFLLWHSENTFNRDWPGKILFSCEHPAEKGGETPFVDNRTIFRRIDKSIRDEFIKKGIMYVRKYGPHDYIGLGWKTIFDTSNKAEVERKCIINDMLFEWGDNDHLITRSIRPAVCTHPETKEQCWINQAQHWHFSCLSESLQQSFRSLYRPDDFSRNCYFGDGSVISDDIMQQILETYRSHQVFIPWQKGDLAVVDNTLIAHARRPYEGVRKLLVCLGDITSFDVC